MACWRRDEGWGGVLRWVDSRGRKKGTTSLRVPTPDFASHAVYRHPTHVPAPRQDGGSKMSGCALVASR